MSEYQYYEFRVCDRQLNREEMAALRRVSSRGEITPTSFKNTYDFGDFKGDPDEWMELYFDAFLYYANWGTRTFKLKLPASLLDPEVIDVYDGDDYSLFRTSGDHVILTVGGQEYDEWNGWMDDWSLSDIIGLRDELARGDLRCLYLAWLIDHNYDEIEYANLEDEAADIEPPVPPGLSHLTESQKSFANLFGLDEDIIAVAASASLPLQRKKENRDGFQAWLMALPPAEKDELLTKLVEERGRSVAMELSNRFERESSPTSRVGASAPRRTVKELTRLRVAYREDRIRREEEAAAAARKKHLDDLASRLPAAWRQVEELAEAKKVNLYDQAIKILVDLQDLATRGDIPDWNVRMPEFRMRHFTKKALLERLDRAGL